MSNTLKIFGVFNENGKLLTVFADKDDAVDYIMDSYDENLYVTEGILDLPVIEETLP